MKRRELPAETLAELRKIADEFNSPGGQDFFKMIRLLDEVSRRRVDPNGRNHPLAGRVAAGSLNGGDLLELLMDGNLPPGFLSAVERMAAAPAQETREACYLLSLIDLRLLNDDWPTKAEATRHAIALFPAVFEAISDTGDKDHMKAFRRLREKLGVDWLMDGEGGRPS
jgi:hypothetical protein